MNNYFFRAVDVYENPCGDLLCKSNDLLTVLNAARQHCIDTDEECIVIIQSSNGINIMSNGTYDNFTASIELIQGLYSEGIIKREDEKKWIKMNN